MASVHDNVIISYEVNLKSNNIILNTEYSDKKVVIVFTDVLAHFFETQLPGSIILDIDNYEIDHFIDGNKEILEKHKAYCWPTDYETLNDLRELLAKEKYNYYVILSSYGLSGWVLAKKYEANQI